jgi:hypothetical protein
VIKFRCILWCPAVLLVFREGDFFILGFRGACFHFHKKVRISCASAANPVVNPGEYRFRLSLTTLDSVSVCTLSSGTLVRMLPVNYGL